jgi:signal transduction histidine kinase/ActR/RegA family two-component response regulator
LLRKIADDNIAETEITHKYTRAFGVLILVILSTLAFFSAYYFYMGRRYREKLNKAVSESKMLAKARENFLANMSHEMRTPLNAITGFTEQLKDSGLDTEQKKQLDIIHSASKHLLNLVNDVLDLSKIEADKVKLEKISFNPRDTINEAVELLRPKAAYKNLPAELEIDEDVPKNLVGDPLRLRQVILNLLSNSIKFTTEGFIRVHVSTLKDDSTFPERVLLQVIVKDTGIGISPEMRDRIFENFTQADSSITRKYGGTGLGLSITKKIVELQGGNISIESEVGKGTAISFVIPFTVSYSPVTKEPECHENYSLEKARGKRVLIADDELFNRILLITILKRWGVEYDEAQNGKEVVQKMNETNYDLVLMDVRMPEMSGIDATRAIRKMNDPRKASVPVIALTAATSDDKKEKCLTAGMNDVITKPYNEKELIRIMERTLSKTTSE